MDNMSMREAYGKALADYGEINQEVVVLDADTSSSTLSNFFADRFPERFYNIGIAEPCMIDVAVGLALGGTIPFANGFASLLSLRALEQVRTCVCYARTNVKLAAHYAGVSAFKDGPTHHSISDIAIMRSLPGMTVIVPADSHEVAGWVPIVAEYDGPVYLRLSRAATLPVHQEGVHLDLGKGLLLRPGGDVSLIGCGAMVGYTLKAAEILAGKGIHARVIEIHTVKPLDIGMIIQAAEETGALVTAEEHSVIGGLGSAVAEALCRYKPVPLEMIGIEDAFARTGPDPESLMDSLGLGISDIVAAAEHVLTRKFR
jgi:transketolase